MSMSSSRPSTARASTSNGGRPNTAQSRPRTAQSRTSGSNTGTGTGRPSRSGEENESKWIVAVIEGKGIGKEVGITAYDQLTGKVSITQLSDTMSFVRTFHHLSLHPPTLILVTDTALPTPDQPGAHRNRLSGIASGRPVQPTLLVQSLMEGWQDVECVPISRKYWNDEAGEGFLKQLMIDDEDRAAVLVAAESKYLALCATSALFKYLETTMTLTFAPGTLKIQWDALEGTMYIDPDTARNLELVTNKSNAKSQMSLFGVLNKTHTPMAERLLRSNLLQPITVKGILDKRLDAVEELIANEEKFGRIKSALQPMVKLDLDKLIANLVQQDQKTDPRRAEKRVSQILSLRVFVRSLISVCDAVEGSHTDLLIRIHRILSDDRLRKMDKIIKERLEEDTAGGTRGKKGGLAMRNAKIYAVKANCNRLLDVARETYKENVHDVLELVKGYQDAYSLPTLNVSFQESGMSMSLSVDDIPADGLPVIFKNVNKKGANQVTCFTLELKKRQQRYTDTLNEIFLLSDQIIQELLEEILEDIGALYKSSEAVAMLDLFWGFAHVASANNYVRPEYVGTLALKGARHPILDRYAGPVVPNDVYSNNTSIFQIIQGPNMSGKSTYLLAIGLMTVQALVGSYVPAEYASFKLYDSLLSRLSNEDDMAGSLSTFALEMRTSASILSLVTKGSLVLIDELGRGTSPTEGVAISHAIAEQLIKTKATVFFATHFRDLTLTLGGYDSVQNLHLQVETHRKGPLTFNYKILEGPSVEAHYGLELAALASLPQDVMEVATDVAFQLGQMERAGREASKSNQTQIRRKILLTWKDKLQVAFKSNLDDSDLAEFLRFLQRELVGDLGIEKKQRGVQH
ncbi:muts domain V-domain-containing protein [Mrakia frigida]|uniref:MutS family protein MSH4 n=1 Tax=Mrakia frigida TaxID=29902 RepID=UPI003FCBF11E